MIYIVYINTILLLAVLAILLWRGNRMAPRVLMENGIIKKGTDIAALQAAARKHGYFNLGDIDCAVQETDGSISLLPKPMHRRLTPKDFNFAPEREGLCVPIAKNGKLLEENIRRCGVGKEELLRIMERRGRTLQEIRFATMNEAGRIDVFE